MFGLSPETLAAIDACLRRYPDLVWVKVYGSRAKGTYRRGSDIDLAFGSPTDRSAELLAALDDLPTPYRFDVTHYESLRHTGLKEHIDQVGVVILNRAGDTVPGSGRDRTQAQAPPPPPEGV